MKLSPKTLEKIDAIQAGLSAEAQKVGKSFQAHAADVVARMQTEARGAMIRVGIACFLAGASAVGILALVIE